MRAAKPELPASVGPGPDNPLGDYALNLGSSLYRIHGTNMPYGVGRRVSSGCIRMYPADIETLFNKVPVGTPVRVVNQPAKLGWIDGDLYLEVHPEGEQLDELEVNYTFEPQLAPEFEEQVARVAGDQVDRVDWSVVVRTWAHRTGVPMRITRTAGEELIGEAPPPRVAAYPDIRPGLDRFADLVQGVAFAAHLEPRIGRLGPPHGFADGAAADRDMVVLDQDAVIKAHAMVGAAAGAHGVFRETAQARNGLPRIEQHRPDAVNGVDVLAGHGCDAGQLLQQVQGRAFRRQQALGRAGEARQMGALGDALAVGHENFDRGLGGEAAEHLQRHRHAG